MITHNDTPNPRLPHSKPKPLTPHRSTICPPNNIWSHHMISLQLNSSTNSGPNNKYTYNISVMTRCNSRKHLSRPPYSSCPKGPSLRNDSFHYLRSSILYWIFLSLLPLKPCPHTRTRRLLTPNRHSPT
ncbi:hypothetical protein MG293_007588 [Ovis ammon polii]|uniref:Uncharacterized protein n=1 Tax=Ovis ammon polii TaxID=230172 RepID=A0AAD4UDG5_OVIAM|nr:hypothetical protein MG293_007588 [Ovis ammon polii]